LGAMGYVLGHDEELFRFAIDRIFSILPAITEGVTSELRSLIAYKSFAITSFALYALLSYQLYAGLHTSLETVFEVPEKRKLWEMILMPLLVVTLIVLLLLLSFVLTSLVPLLTAYQEYVPLVIIGDVTKVLMRYVIPLMIVQFIVMIVYIVIPKTPVSIDNAFKGAFFTAIMLEGAKHLFTWYVSSISSLGTMYGSMAVFVTFLLWMYYSSSIFLIGAEIVHQLTGNEGRRSADRRKP
ncbi:YihY/virulence factor BrkB family protein, partial [Nitrospirota bacterium]